MLRCTLLLHTAAHRLLGGVEVGVFCEVKSMFRLSIYWLVSCVWCSLARFSFLQAVSLSFLLIVYSLCFRFFCIRAVNASSSSK